MSDQPLSSGAFSSLPLDCEKKTLGVVFIDLARFAEWASTDQDESIANFLQRFYELVSHLLAPAGGGIVKFMGDGVMAVFDPESADSMVAALDRLAKDGRELARQSHLDTYVNIRVHVGPVLSGSFGAPGQEHYDVIGKTVNIAARLGRRGMTLSPQAFRCLSPAVRKQFDKNMPPITYRRSTTY